MEFVVTDREGAGFKILQYNPLRSDTEELFAYSQL